MPNVDDPDKKRKSSLGENDFLPPLMRHQDRVASGKRQMGVDADDKEMLNIEQGHPISQKQSLNPMPLEASTGSPISAGGAAPTADFSRNADDYAAVDQKLPLRTKIPSLDQQQSKIQARDLKKMTSIIAAELNQLGQEGRKLAFADVHGVNESDYPHGDDGAAEEETGATNSRVAALLSEIKRIRERSALDKAIFLAPEYVRNPNFCLMFLRAERFDANLAARRLARHFKLKLELFGLELLARDIRLEDLNLEDKKALFTGSEQYLGKDRSGRTILFSSFQQRQYKSVENQMRAIWYLTMRRLNESNSLQHKGAVVLRYNVGGLMVPRRNEVVTRDDSFDFTRKSCSLLAAFPLKVKSFHFCYDDVRFLPSLMTSQKLIGRDLRVRFRIHYGSFKECLQSLRTFGIPKEVLPLNPGDGGVSNSLFHLYLDECQKQELQRALSADKSENCHLIPLNLDVLLGRGRPYQEFSGNVKLARLIDNYIDAYASGTKSAKSEIIDRIMNKVKQWGGRFLKKNEKKNGEWTIANPDDSREKVSHVFRAKLRRNSENASPVVSCGGSTEDGVMNRTHT